MTVLSDKELRMIADIVTEMSKYRGPTLDKEAKNVAFGRAALLDPDFRARLAEVHRQLGARRMLVPIAIRDLERDVERILAR
jgi:hypothetical protein